MVRIYGLLTKVGFDLVARDELDSSAFDVVVAAVEGLPNLEDFVKIARHSVLDDFVGCAATLRGEILQFLFGLGGKVYFHTFNHIGKLTVGQRCLSQLGVSFVSKEGNNAWFGTP